MNGHPKSKHSITSLIRISERGDETKTNKSVGKCHTVLLFHCPHISRKKNSFCFRCQSMIALKMWL